MFTVVLFFIIGESVSLVNVSFFIVIHYYRAFHGSNSLILLLVSTCCISLRVYLLSLSIFSGSVVNASFVYRNALVRNVPPHGSATVLLFFLYLHFTCWCCRVSVLVSVV